MEVFSIFFFATFLSLSVANDSKRLLEAESTYLEQLEQAVQTLKANMADMTGRVAELTTKVTNLTQDLAIEKAKNAASGQTGSGGSYVRWGRSSCPNNTSDLVYTGFAGASWYNDAGTATNYLCLTTDPEWQTNSQIVPYNGGPRIFGVEYYFPPGASNVVNYDDVPCAVCRSHQPTVVMIPGRRTCYPGWTTEYKGYISAGGRSTGSSEFVCLDENPTAIPHGTSKDYGGFFEPTTAHCGSLTCPPYKGNEIVMCVVCSK